MNGLTLEKFKKISERACQRSSAVCIDVLLTVYPTRFYLVVFCPLGENDYEIVKFNSDFSVGRSEQEIEDAVRDAVRDKMET